MQTLSKEKIASTYQQLLASKKTTSRGYALEKLIAAVLSNERLEAKTSYRPKGEEIDGSFFWQGQTFLLEAKWLKNPVPASTVYSFKGKVDGKFHTTSGIFISMNGYSPDAVEAVKAGKSLNVIFFDGEDMVQIFLGNVPFLDMFKYKLRQAGDTGAIYAPYKLRDQANEIANEEPAFFSERGKHKEMNLTKEILVFVEGKSDVSFAQKLLAPVATRHLVSFGVVAMNGFNSMKDLPALLNTYGTNKNLRGAIILLDEDAKPFEPVLLNILDQIEKSANPVKVMWQYLSDDRKKALSDSLSKEDFGEGLDEDDIFSTIDFFIDELLYKERDPMYYIPAATIKSILAAIEWDKKNGIAFFEAEGDRDPDGRMENIDDLVAFIEERITSDLESEIPWVMMRDAYDHDHNWAIREYISKHYLDKIESIGWDPHDV
jgi:hypothetical protein